MKWVGRILFTIAVGLIGYLVYVFSFGQIYSEYYNANSKKIETDEFTFMNFTVQTMTSDYNCYVLREPIYTYKNKVEKEDGTKYQIELKIFAISFVSKDINKTEHHDALMFLINDLVVKDAISSFNDVSKADVIFSLALNQPTEISEGRFTTSLIQTSYNLAKTGARIFFIDAGALRGQDGSYSNIDTVAITQEQTDGKTRLLLSLSKFKTTIGRDAFFDLENEAEELEVRRINLSYESYNLSERVGGKIPIDDPLYYYEILDIMAFQWVIVRNMIIYSFIVVVVTYFAFFHKKIVYTIKDRRYQKKLEEEKMKLEEEKKKLEEEKKEIAAVKRGGRPKNHQ